MFLIFKFVTRKTKESFITRTNGLLVGTKISVHVGDISAFPWVSSLYIGTEYFLMLLVQQVLSHFCSSIWPSFSQCLLSHSSSLTAQLPLFQKFLPLTVFSLSSTLHGSFNQYCTSLFTTIAGTLELEQTCGRPLGMRFDRYGINLIVADAYYGLLEVNPRARTVNTLVPPTPGINGKPFRFVNDLDIARDGTIYFTDSSTKWQRCQVPHIMFEGEATGRLMAYHPKTGDMEVLMEGLHFANGVQLSPEGDHVLVAETTMSRIMKWGSCFSILPVVGRDKAWYCAFHNHMNSKVQKPPSQWIAFVVVFNHNHHHKQRTLKHRNTKKIEIYQSQITNHDLLNPLK